MQRKTVSCKATVFAKSYAFIRTGLTHDICLKSLCRYKSWPQNKLWFYVHLKVLMFLISILSVIT